MSENIIKRVCREQGLTYAQLGDFIGYGEEAISKASRTGEISKPMLKAAELLLENISLKSEVTTIDNLRDTLKSILERK